MSTPQDLAEVENVPHGRTARRLEWTHLPPAVRALVERHLGSPVATAESQGAGFTPGFASRLTGEDGSRLFVKAASKKAQAPFAESYAEEVRKLALLPAGLPVPQLLWSHEDDLWIVLGFECVDARPPKRPWRPAELTACLDTLAVVAEASRSTASTQTGPSAGQFQSQSSARPWLVTRKLSSRASEWTNLSLPGNES